MKVTNSCSVTFEARRSVFTASSRVNIILSHGYSPRNDCWNTSEVRRWTTPSTRRTSILDCSALQPPRFKRVHVPVIISFGFRLALPVLFFRRSFQVRLDGLPEEKSLQIAGARLLTGGMPSVVKVVMWSRGEGSPDEARLERTPYPFHTQLIWHYLGIKYHFIRFNQGADTIAGAQIGAGAEPPWPPHFNLWMPFLHAINSVKALKEWHASPLLQLIMRPRRIIVRLKQMLTDSQLVIK